MSYSLARSPLRLPGSADIYMFHYLFIHVCLPKTTHGFSLPMMSLRFTYVSLVVLQIALNYIDVLVTLAAFAELVFFWAFRTEMGVNPMRSSCKFQP
jgi:hypothetical protein